MVDRSKEYSYWTMPQGYGGNPTSGYGGGNNMQAYFQHAQNFSANYANFTGVNNGFSLHHQAPPHHHHKDLYGDYGTHNYQRPAPAHSNGGGPPPAHIRTNSYQHPPGGYLNYNHPYYSGQQHQDYSYKNKPPDHHGNGGQQQIYYQTTPQQHQVHLNFHQQPLQHRTNYVEPVPLQLKNGPDGLPPRTILNTPNYVSPVIKDDEKKHLPPEKSLNTLPPSPSVKAEENGNKKKKKPPVTPTVTPKRLKEDDIYAFDEEESITPSFPMRLPKPFSGVSSKGVTVEKKVALKFDDSEKVFMDTCEDLISDLVSKPVSVSRQHNVELLKKQTSPVISLQKNIKKLKKEEEEEEKKIEEVIQHQPLPLQPPTLPTHVEIKTNSHPPFRPPPMHCVSAGYQPFIPDSESRKNPYPAIFRPIHEPRSPTEPPPKSPASPKLPPPKTQPTLNPPMTKKGGTLWALPIVPKLPQKNSESLRKKPDSSTGSVQASTQQPTSVKDVWLSAFGAKDSPKKPETAEIKAKTSVLDIPPEARRRPRPDFGGIIHFAPDWEKGVRNYYEKNRIPASLIKTIKVTPKILESSPRKSANASKNLSEEENGDQILSQEIKEKETTFLAKKKKHVKNIFESEINTDPDEDLSPSRNSFRSNNPFPNIHREVGRNLNSVVDSILENRKKLRATMGRMFRLPFMKEKKKTSRKEVGDDGDQESEDYGLLPTPGLPSIDSPEAEDLFRFGNFRKITLQRYLVDDSSLTAKLLDWKPEVLECKTRRGSSKLKINYLDIFGLNLPKKFDKELPPSPLKPSITKPVIKIEPETPLPIKKTLKYAKKTPPAPVMTKLNVVCPPIIKRNKIQPEEEKEKEVVYPEKNVPIEEALQESLQKFALELLNLNPSWSDRTVIQNLVIWEPLDPVTESISKPTKRTPYKKTRKRKSGMDFSNSAKKKKNSSNKTLSTDDEVSEVLYTLDNVIAETKGWVIDKRAGETILHRASKMGYPDAAAYALDVVKLSPSSKDNAGILPLHKAAFKGHPHVALSLLKYGADPNANVKGTRPMHEALEGGNPECVYHLLRYGSDPLLYDYSGNMPIDLTEDDPELHTYLSAILGDLHGKETPVWNVSHRKDFVIPDKDIGAEENENSENISFELCSSPPPPEFALRGKNGSWILARDIKTKPNESHEFIELSREDFIANSRCLLLGASPNVPPNKSTVKLYLATPAIRKQCGIVETVQCLL